jgi:2,3-dihydroxy-p-cumate/2,3-dihydroxybenzoate 3,4-dioxygenase
MASIDYRYGKLGYVAFNVTDLERSVAFYRDMVGLAVTDLQPGKQAFLRCTGQHHELALYQAARAGVKRIAFEMESGKDLDAAQAALKSLDVAVEQVPREEASAMHVGRAIRYRVPGTGIPIELYDAMSPSPAPYQQTVAKITRMGHIVLNVKDWEKTVSWFQNKVNFKTSDYVEGMFAFLRPFPNPLHHSLGLGKAPSTGLHHLMFMVSEIDDIGKALNRFRKAKVPVSFGPGRHVASTSVFLYFEDPDGMTIEYSFGMELFDEKAPREHRMLKPALETVDEWGGAPAASFGKVGEIEGASA